MALLRPEVDDVGTQLPQPCPQPVEELVVVDVGVRPPLALHQQQGGIDPEAVDPDAEPETQQLDELFEDVRIGGVDIGLERVELVVVVTPGPLVERPDALLLAREHRMVPRLGRVVVAPDEELARPPVGVLPRREEPRMPVRGVMRNGVDEHAHPELVGARQEGAEAVQVAEARIHGQVVVDVVAVVPPQARVERQQPDPGDAERRHMVEPGQRPRQIAEAVAVAVGEPGQVEAVDERAGVGGPARGDVGCAFWGGGHPPLIRRKVRMGDGAGTRVGDGAFLLLCGFTA
jgi:hypothetical protein